MTEIGRVGRSGAPGLRRYALMSRCFDTHVHRGRHFAPDGLLAKLEE